MKPYDLYAFVTESMWNESLHSIWPYAPPCRDYRLLVFSSDNIPSIELVEFEVERVIEAMTAGENYAFMCELEEARYVVDSLKDPNEIVGERL